MSGLPSESCMLVDTSAWVEWLRATGSVSDQLLSARLARGDDVVTTGIVVQEVLQGCRDERHAADVRRLLVALRAVEPSSPETHEHAAALFRRCRRAGRGVRGAVDCLIAAIALEHDLPVLTEDRDFETLHAVCGVRLAVPARW